MLASRSQDRYSERGAATVEFAVVASLLLLILFGIMELGLTFFQKHYVSHVAREGLRIGVIANNYSCFNEADSGTCTSADPNPTDRWDAVNNSIRNDLAIFYGPDSVVSVDIESPESENDEATRKPLIITVAVNNFMPSIISGFVPGYTWPENIQFTVTGDYEDPKEW
ncbi:MAG: hypothetical protein C0624_07315 [Desulfuromonas sp.]|nr:MAG: hypothetical protein C0624_07315 [Desulfuromonas sp.]